MRKNWYKFLLCLLLSGSIWLFMNLSQTYADIVNVAVLPKSNIEGRSEFASSEVTVSARCQATGWRLISLSSNDKAKPVTFDAADLERTRDGAFRISAATMYKYVQAVFGDNVDVESFVTDGITMNFTIENNKKVPVVPVKVVSFKPQYMARSEMALTPDSVLVYGEAARLNSIDAVYTRQINLNELRSSVHGVTRLEEPSGVRLSHTEATYSLEVTRYVEVSSRVNVSVRNLPSKVKVTLLPSMADVTYRCAFPLGKSPVGRTEFYVDYREFANSITGKCVIRHDDLPDGVINVRIEPEVCECIMGQSSL